MGLLKGTRELKKGSAEFLILSLVDGRARHGYDIARLIEQRSSGILTFHAASLYPLLYKLEKLGWIDGRWTEKAGERRKRVYKITREGRKVLAEHRGGWETFVRAIGQVVGGEHA
jgi:PadR family transcriptional regulator, regulatory protein PadR